MQDCGFALGTRTHTPACLTPIRLRCFSLEPCSGAVRKNKFMIFNQRFSKFTFNFHSSGGEAGGQLSRQSHSKLEPTEVSRWEEWREFFRPERRGWRGTALPVVSQCCLFLAGVLGVVTYSLWASVFSSADGTGNISQALCLTCCAY